MPAEELRQWLWQAPFVPFRLYLLESKVIEVRHPEMFVIKLVTADVFHKEADEAIPETKRKTTIALRHITRIEPSPRSTAAASSL